MVGPLMAIRRRSDGGAGASALHLESRRGSGRPRESEVDPFATFCSPRQPRFE
jgi:hypothetical protein